MSKQYLLDYAEFYITNVCNLNCPRCNRFNNYVFSGHYSWDEFKDEYTKWSKILDVEKIGILGGEPFSHPDLEKWVRGIANLWPKSKIEIVTNGTYQDKIQDFYSILKEYNGRISLDINWHKNDRTLINELKDSMLQGAVTETITFNKTLWQQCYNAISGPSWPKCDTPDEFKQLPLHIQEECSTVHNFSYDIFLDNTAYISYRDQNNVLIAISKADYFNEPTLKFDGAEFSLYNSVPKEALEICYSKKCHHFVDGKLYKCGPLAVLPKFLEQYDVNLTSKQRDLIESYQPAAADWSATDLDMFFKNLKTVEVIDQCSICPSKFNPVQFEAGTKKIKLTDLRKQLSNNK